MKKFKVRDFEGEFSREGRSPAEPESAQTETLGAAEAAPPPSVLETVQPEQPEKAGTPEFFDIFTAFKEHNYAEGMRLAKLRIATSNQDGFTTEAFYVWVAHLEGNPQAYADAEKLAAAHPQLFDPQYYFGLISVRTGKTDAAVTLLKKALALGTNAEDRVRAATSLQQELSRIERHKEALDVLTDQLKQTDTPELRAKLFVSMAKAHAEGAPVDHRAMFLMYELALKNTPDDTSLRFDVAFKYSEQGAHELAFVHYRRLLQNDSKHIMALNNIGVDAGSLNLPLTAVTYFKSSQAMDNTLASSNLANRLIDAGFKAEAEAVLTTAKGKSDVHRNVSFSIGRLAQGEATEEQQITKLSERVGKVRRWHVRHGEAALQDLEPTTLSGAYTGVPIGLDLTVQPDGTAKGTFTLTATSIAVLTGSVTGAALTFDWTENSDKGVMSLLGRKSGHGLLIGTGNGQLDGYWAEGTERIDAKDVDKWTQWRLSQKPAS